jgi:hypothetical protein
VRLAPCALMAPDPRGKDQGQTVVASRPDHGVAGSTAGSDGTTTPPRAAHVDFAKCAKDQMHELHEQKAKKAGSWTMKQGQRSTGNPWDWITWSAGKQAPSRPRREAVPHSSDALPASSCSQSSASPGSPWTPFSAAAGTPPPAVAGHATPQAERVLSALDSLSLPRDHDGLKIALEREADAGLDASASHQSGSVSPGVLRLPGQGGARQGPGERGPSALLRGLASPGGAQTAVLLSCAAVCLLIAHLQRLLGLARWLLTGHLAETAAAACLAILGVQYCLRLLRLSAPRLDRAADGFAQVDHLSIRRSVCLFVGLSVLVRATSLLPPVRKSCCSIWWRVAGWRHMVRLSGKVLYSKRCSDSRDTCGGVGDWRHR